MNKPRFEATIRHTMHESGPGAAEQLAMRLCSINRDEATRYIALLQKSRAADSIANHPSSKWGDT